MAGILTPIGYLYFPSLFEARGNKQVPGQAPRFSGMLLFDKTGTGSQQYQVLRQGVFDALVSKFGAAKANDANFVKGCRLPFRQASEKTYDGFTDGEVFISAWSNEDQRPGVVDLQGNNITDKSLVYGGQLARYTVRPFAYDTSGNRGVGLILEHAQIVKFDMPRRDGGVAPDQAFKAADNSQLAALGIDPNAMSNPAMAGASGAAGQTAYQQPADATTAAPASGLPF